MLVVDEAKGDLSLYAYGQAKLANILHGDELARRFNKVTHLDKFNKAHERHFKPYFSPGFNSHQNLTE